MAKYEVSVNVGGTWSDTLNYTINDALNQTDAKEKAIAMAYEDDSIYPRTDVQSADVDEIRTLDDDNDEEPNEEAFVDTEAEEDNYDELDDEEFEDDDDDDDEDAADNEDEEDEEDEDDNEHDEDEEDDEFEEDDDFEDDDEEFSVDPQANNNKWLDESDENQL